MNNYELLVDGLIEHFERCGDTKIAMFIKNEKENILQIDWVLDLLADVVDYVNNRVESKNTFYGVVIPFDDKRRTDKDY